MKQLSIPAYISPSRIVLLSSIFESTYAPHRLESSTRKFLQREYSSSGSRLQNDHTLTMNYSAGFYALFSDQVLMWCTVNPDFDTTQPISDTNPTIFFDVLAQVTYRGQYQLSSDGRVLAVASNSQHDAIKGLGLITVFVDGKKQLKAETLPGTIVLHQVTSSFPALTLTPEQKKKGNPDELLWPKRDEFANGVGYICYSIVTEPPPDQDTMYPRPTFSQHIIRYGGVCDQFPLPFEPNPAMIAFAIDPKLMRCWGLILGINDKPSSREWVLPFPVRPDLQKTLSELSCYVVQCSWDGSKSSISTHVVIAPPVLVTVTADGNLVAVCESRYNTDHRDNAPSSLQARCDFLTVMLQTNGEIKSSGIYLNARKPTNTNLQVYCTQECTYLYWRSMRNSPNAASTEYNYDDISTCLIGFAPLENRKRTFVFDGYESRHDGWFVPKFQSRTMVYTTIGKTWDIPWSDEAIVPSQKERELAEAKLSKEEDDFDLKLWFATKPGSTTHSDIKDSISVTVLAQDSANIVTETPVVPVSETPTIASTSQSAKDGVVTEDEEMTLQAAKEIHSTDK